MELEPPTLGRGVELVVVLVTRHLEEELHHVAEIPCELVVGRGTVVEMRIHGGGGDDPVASVDPDDGRAGLGGLAPVRIPVQCEGSCEDFERLPETLPQERFK